MKGAQSWRLSILLLYLPRIYTPMHDRGTHFVFYGTVVLIQKKYLFRTMKNKEPLSSNMIFYFAMGSLIFRKLSSKVLWRTWSSFNCYLSEIKSTNKKATGSKSLIYHTMIAELSMALKNVVTWISSRIEAQFKTLARLKDKKEITRTTLLLGNYRDRE